MSVILQLILDILELQMKSKKEKSCRRQFAFLNSLKGWFVKRVWETLLYIDDTIFEFTYNFLSECRKGDQQVSNTSLFGIHTQEQRVHNKTVMPES